MSGVLVVVHPFGRHKVGDVIGELSEIRESLLGEHASYVVRTQIVDAKNGKAGEA